MKKKFLSLFLCLLLLFSTAAQAAAGGTDTEAQLKELGTILYETVPAPQPGSVGGEWVIIGLARSGLAVPAAYYEAYYQALEQRVLDCGGVLHSRKNTEYARTVLALTAIGKNPAAVAGYNLLVPLGDFEKTIRQGLNGAIWALIALDSADYEIPQNPDASTQADRELYLQHILDAQLPNGGWALSGDTPDPDITSMALQALAKYQAKDEVQAAVEKALDYMSAIQTESGGFQGSNGESAESTAQMLVALCELGIAPEDSRFTKSGGTLLDSLMSYYLSGKGFRHTHSTETANQMTTEQCFYALAAVRRLQSGKSSLYRMTDVASPTGRHEDVQMAAVMNPGKTFADIQSSPERTAIEALAARGIINGKDENSFEPKSTMTRAEFAAIMTRGLSLPQKSGAAFTDVAPGDWFFNVVGTAYAYGIIKGVSETAFHPDSTITREEAAVMLVRAAGLCGLETEQREDDIQSCLAAFSDSFTVSVWARAALAFCCGSGILAGDTTEIKPTEAVTRAEIAAMLYNTLSLAELM